MNYKNIFIAIFLIFVFTGCFRDIPTIQQRTNTLQSLVPNDVSYRTKIIQTDSYRFYSIQQQKKQCRNVHVYFEGDGLAWITRRLMSEDPTPLNPIAFKLMLQDDSKCKVYVARACQYTNDSYCTQKDWTNNRFSKDIVESMNQAITQIKKQYNNTYFTFIGYSGGAAVASIIANSRNDVNNFISVAGNLDTQLWTEIKNYIPLSGLNPVNHTENLQTIRQYHLIGNNDNIIPEQLVYSYINTFSNKNGIKIKKVEATHHCCYEKDFKELIQGID